MRFCFVIPYAIAEFVRGRVRKQFDWAVWTAMDLAIASVMIFIHPILIARANYIGPAFWEKTSLGDISETYRELFTLTLPPILGCVLGYLCHSSATDSIREFSAATTLAS